MRLSFTQAADFYRERDFGQKISATLEFLGAHWRPLGRVLAYVMLPALLVRSVLQALIQHYLPMVFSRPAVGTHIDSTYALQLQASMWKTIFTSSAYWTSSLVGSISFSLMVVSVYGYLVLLARRRTPGPPPTVAEVWALARYELVGTFVCLWGVGVLVGMGFFFLAIPGIYLSVVLSLFFIVKLSEGSDFGATFSRCWQLIRGKWWSTFGLIAIALLLYYVVLAGIGGVAVMVSGGFSDLMQAARTKSPLLQVVVGCINSLSSLLFYPPLLLVLAFQYFNLVERQDGTGLRLLVDSLGQTAAPQVSNAAYQPYDEGEY
ncbi:hypothetical protein [Hymenobacter properus]|uniref:Glycerophosphoryl diester phosphodiesterase membrane domain-containing protein n=1 Tax=Hymenobacter properus TaxID=2791026 RepID=A0A931FLN4_9BACT|nr:hypothetical protein [Hymenobacter properus]MBF9142201.1 hypothetical protein [Hymenobacter properus]MBR7721008.1 hypothetical protein [Microvirga sp. SRT04]